jgi:hypothetical protein
MLVRIKNFFKAIFDVDTPQHELDDYLESKNITNIVELEYWMAEYDRKKRIRSRLISEGKFREASWAMKL